MPSDARVQIIQTPGIGLPPGATWSNCLKIGSALHFSGVTARNSAGETEGGADVEGQTRACFEKLHRQLAAAGGGLHNIYKLVIYLTDMREKDAVNRARAALFTPAFPCSTLIGCADLVFPELKVEVDAFADLTLDLRTAV